MAWISLGKDVLIWKNDQRVHKIFVYSSSSSITSCDCIRPKKAFYDPDIEYLVVISTITRVFLLALSQDNRILSRNITRLTGFKVVPFQIDDLKADTIRCVCAHDSNQIFFGGQKGRLYQIDYRNWSTKKRKQIYNSHQLKGGCFHLSLILIPFREFPAPITHVVIEKTAGMILCTRDDNNLDIVYNNAFQQFKQISKIIKIAHKKLATIKAQSLVTFHVTRNDGEVQYSYIVKPMGFILKPIFSVPQKTRKSDFARIVLGKIKKDSFNVEDKFSYEKIAVLTILGTNFRNNFYYAQYFNMIKKASKTFAIINGSIFKKLHKNHPFAVNKKFIISIRIKDCNSEDNHLLTIPTASFTVLRCTKNPKFFGSLVDLNERNGVMLLAFVYMAYPGYLSESEKRKYKTTYSDNRQNNVDVLIRWITFCIEIESKTRKYYYKIKERIKTMLNIDLLAFGTGGKLNFKNKEENSYRKLNGKVFTTLITRKTVELQQKFKNIKICLNTLCSISLVWLIGQTVEKINLRTMLYNGIGELKNNRDGFSGTVAIMQLIRQLILPPYRNFKIQILKVFSF
eukprot:gnl/MRDRNA2_/MRDRNA2_85074_c0_seq1.p1 gnl/MRDRNA2_/MRDRNA2_85074_c0~~gnl/MRDRNA2_/MRDRNA2_85074_c0_seq1.p1  ORF type:complete len:569 (+),score=-42.58 gnl/MRDRNA2_/MRDRNA2_85074_c0_seq1:127-1833(+)